MIGRDAADGRMRLTPLLRRFDVRWSKEGSAALFADLERTAHELAAAAQATPFYALEGGPLGKFMTVHPLGGCPMGDDPATSVVDDAGRVRGMGGLVVLDGSIVPTALGVNPSKTIAAVAERGHRPRCSRRMTLEWRNHAGDQRCRPERIAHPRSTEELQEIVTDAEAAGRRVRAVGAGHAWSDVALTDGTLVETDELSGVEILGEDLVRVRGGTRVRDLNAALDAHGLGLRNMGGYDGQAIAGVVATSTHGSGLGFGPFPDDVRSIDLVASGGAARAASSRTTTGSTPSPCGMGCMGIVDSLVLRGAAALLAARAARRAHVGGGRAAELDDRLAAEEHSSSS